uniref:Arf-GAP domain-containing protein n=1 Tax=Anopheles minimus TaxID=112268 RepID=A0A182VT14_9DIPT
MALVRKKLDDKILKTLRELVGVGGNKECFDCGQKGPTYINMTIGSFVCTSCSGILRCKQLLGLDKSGLPPGFKVFCNTNGGKAKTVLH